MTTLRFIGRVGEKRRKGRGFTLIETIVSIALLATAATGPLLLSSSTLKATKDARNELTATMLAEEGIEMIRNIRDNLSADDASVDRAAWVVSYFGKCQGPKGCIIDITDRVAASDNDVWKLNVAVNELPNFADSTNFDSQNDTIVWFNPGTGFFRQDKNGVGGLPWVDSGFRRWILLTPRTDPAELDVNGNVREFAVDVYVSYRGVGGRKLVHLTDRLMNWYPNI